MQLLEIDSSPARCLTMLDGRLDGIDASTFSEMVYSSSKLTVVRRDARRCSTSVSVSMNALIFSEVV